MNKPSRSGRLAWQILCLGAAWCGPATAEGVEQVERGGVTRPPLPAYQQPAAPRFVLPPLDPVPAQGAPSTGVRVMVRAVRLEGHSAEFGADLRRIASAYENRVLGSDDLQQLRHQLTLYYVNRGYINSGALLSDQEIRDGVVTLRIVEGGLNRIEISGHQRLRPDYISGRLELGARTPLNIAELQQRLQLLQQGGLIERVNAELLPGVQAGESVLKVAIQEARPYQITASFSNHRSPSVGAYRPEIYGTHHNLSGRGDTIEARYGVSKGLDDYLLGYSLPLNAHDTTLSLRYSRSDSLVVEAPFADLDIESRTITESIGISHPLWQTLSGAFTLGLSYEHRSSDTWLLGVPFSFSSGIDEGRSAERVWRFSQDWVSRGPDQVLALRSTFSLGSNNALPRENDIGPEQNFLAWLAQFQWARRLADRSQTLFRLDAQFSRDALLPMDKLGLGGATSIRGYRENQMLRDRGFVASLEYRMPVFTGDTGESHWQLAPFIDYGHGWNVDGSPATPASLSSIGLGLLWNPDRKTQAQLYAAKALRNVHNTGHDLQDAGIHFHISRQLY